MSRDTFHQTRFLKAPSNLALNTAREGQPQLPWATCVTTEDNIPLFPPIYSSDGAERVQRTDTFYYFFLEHSNTCPGERRMSS